MAGLGTRVVRVTFNPEEKGPRWPYKVYPSCFGAAVLYPLEVKRRLRTRDRAKARAVWMARGVFKRERYRPPDFRAMACSAEVTMFDARSRGQPWQFWQLKDGTRVWIVELEWNQPPVGL